MKLKALAFIPFLFCLSLLGKSQDTYSVVLLKNDKSGYKLRITRSNADDQIVQAEWWYPEYKSWKSSSNIKESSWDKFSLISAVSGKTYHYSVDKNNAQNWVETAPDGKTVVYREPYMFHHWSADDGSGYKIRMTTTPDQGVPPISAEWYSPSKQKWIAFELESYDPIDVVYKLKSPVTGKVYTYFQNTRTGFNEGYRGGGGEKDEHGLQEIAPDGAKRFYLHVSSEKEAH